METINKNEKGIILTNVGTPASDGLADVRTFIGDMLSDPHLTDMSKLRSTLLARCIIAPLSAKSSREKYRIIWRKEKPITSPLQYYMRELAKSLEKKKGIPVEVSMRYGKPSFSDAVRELKKKCSTLKEVIIFPLYPHFAQSTTQTAVEDIEKIYKKRSYPFSLKVIDPYFNHPAFINALAVRSASFLKDIDHLVFSYHSLPVSQIEEASKKGNDFDYIYQVNETNRLFCEKVGFDFGNTSLFFSSQRGDHWMKPFLDNDIKNLPAKGYKSVAIMGPGFPTDNMETLYDMDYEARKLFMEAGGEKFTFIPSLNDHEAWVEAIWEIIKYNTP